MEIPNGIKNFAIIQNATAKEKNLSKRTVNPESGKERNARANLISWNLNFACIITNT